MKGLNEMLERHREEVMEWILGRVKKGERIEKGIGMGTEGLSTVIRDGSGIVEMLGEGDRVVVG